MLGRKSILAGASAMVLAVSAQAMAANGIDQRWGGSQGIVLVNGPAGHADPNHRGTAQSTAEAAGNGRFATRARNVPEPSYLGLAGMAASVLIMRRRRGRSLFGH